MHKTIAFGVRARRGCRLRGLRCGAGGGRLPWRWNSGEGLAAIHVLKVFHRHSGSCRAFDYFAAVAMVLLSFAAFGPGGLSTVNERFDNDAHQGCLQAVNRALHFNSARRCSLSDLIDRFLQHRGECHCRCSGSGSGGSGRVRRRGKRQALDCFGQW